MDILIVPLTCLLSLFIYPYGYCASKRICNVVENKYFEEYENFVYEDPYRFDEVNFTVAAFCHNIEDLQLSLQEIPLETDWLCLSITRGIITVKTESFCRLTNLKTLYIYGTFMLQPGSFKCLQNLSALSIHLNDPIDNFDFHGLNIQQLRISGISFLNLNKLFSHNLNKLENLILENNNISSLSSVIKQLTNCTSLKNVSIVQNNMGTITIHDCVPGIYLNISSLTFSTINSFGNNSLCNFPNLSSLKTSINKVKTILQSGLAKLKNISFPMSHLSGFEICLYVLHLEVEQMDLSFNEMKVIRTSKGSCNTLRILDLSFNDIEKVTFVQIKKLETVWDLNVSYNKINSVSFCSKNSSLNKMELLYLNLSFNVLTVLQPGQFSCLTYLRKLCLTDNHIHAIKNCSFCGLEKLEVLNLEFNNIYKLGEYDFKNLFSLKQLNLKENVLEEIEDWAFLDLHQLEEITLTFKNNVEEMWALKYIAKYLKKLSLKSNDLYITLLDDYIAAMDQLESLELEARLVNIGDCEHFPFLNIRQLRIINSIEFICLPSFSQALEKFTNIEKLYISSDNRQTQGYTIFNSSLKHLRKIEFLQLEGTETTVVSSLVNEEEFFKGLKNLKTLYLKSSGIDFFSSETVFKDLKSLKILIIEDQHIQKLKENIFSPMQELKYIYLISSSLACSCELSWLNEWLAYNKNISFIDYSRQTCFVRLQNQYYNLVSFLDKNCKTEIEFTFFIISLSSLLLFMSISLFYESLWWYIQYVFYTIKCWLNHRWRKRIRGQYEYDVFVSYNTQNEQWVTEQLLPNLEECGPPFFKVCIHNRDFVIGRDIVDNIMDSLYNSRWTICLISHSYLQSNWCSLEMQMATYRLVAESKDSLIIVFLDKISREELQYHHKLTKLLGKKTYLDWPDDANSQQLFWARLRKVVGGGGGD